MISSKHFISENLHHSTQTIHSARTVKRVIFFFQLHCLCSSQNTERLPATKYDTQLSQILFYSPVSLIGKTSTIMVQIHTQQLTILKVKSTRQSGQARPPRTPSPANEDLRSCTALSRCHSSLTRPHEIT